MSVPSVHPGNLRAKRESRASDPGLEPMRPTILGGYAYDAGSLHLPHVALGARQCKFPVNDAAPGELHLFCGRDTDDGPYCAHHNARAFNGLTAAYAVQRELRNSRRR